MRWVRILIISSNYYPEPLGIGLYSTDLARVLKQQGNDVTVLTTFPYYPWWNTPHYLSEFAVTYSQIDEIAVYRTPIRIGSSSKTLGRAIFEARLWFGLLRVYRKIENQKFDKVISIIPSLGAGLVARKVANASKKPHYLVIQDITTIGVSQSGMSFGALLQRLIYPIERLIMRSAKSIAVVSQMMAKPVCEMSGNSIPVLLIPNYEIEALELTPPLTRSEFAIPPEKFIVIHAGSIAKKQDLENIVKAARLLKSTNIEFFLFGHGNTEADILTASQDLGNLHIRPPVPREQLSSLLKCADLLIVNERPTQISMALPSKLISYFSSGVPVLAAVPKFGATYKMIDGLAFWVEAGKPEMLAETIEKISNSDQSRRDYASAGFTYFNEHLRTEQGRKRYISWLMDTDVN
jgi:colanic acid biosynthesis glycosyl transferase WcaI